MSVNFLNIRESIRAILSETIGPVDIPPAAKERICVTLEERLVQLYKDAGGQTNVDTAGVVMSRSASESVDRKMNRSAYSIKKPPAV